MRLRRPPLLTPRNAKTSPSSWRRRCHRRHRDLDAAFDEAWRAASPSWGGHQTDLDAVASEQPFFLRDESGQLELPEKPLRATARPIEHCAGAAASAIDRADQKAPEAHRSSRNRGFPEEVNDEASRGFLVGAIVALGRSAGACSSAAPLRVWAFSGSSNCRFSSRRKKGCSLATASRSVDGRAHSATQLASLIEGRIEMR